MQKFLKQISRVWKPHRGQKEFLEHPAKFKVLACGRRWGKTDACAIQILSALAQDEPTKHLILAPTLDQARLLFQRVVDLLQQVLPSEQSLVIKFTPYPKLTFGAHQVIARSGHIGRSLRGNEATHIVIDEAAFVPEELITEIAMPMLATTNGNLTMISTPCGTNHFWRFFRMGVDALHGIWSRTAPTSESPLVSTEYLEIQRSLISERAFKIEYQAEFLDSAGRLFRTESIEKCLVSRIQRFEELPVVIGVDWARYSDYTAVVAVAGYRNESHLVGLDHFHQLTWQEQLDRVSRFIEKFPNASVVCDANGIGDPLIEMLRLRLPQRAITPFVFTHLSKTQIVDNLAWMIENAALKMTPEPQLIKEFQHFEITSSPSGKPRYQAQHGFHDDLVMALSMAAGHLRQSYVPSLRLGDRRNSERQS